MQLYKDYITAVDNQTGQCAHLLMYKRISHQGAMEAN